MTKREIASLAIKLMGVFILLKSISLVPTALGGMYYSLHSERLLYAVGMIILSVVIFGISVAWALLIIFFSDKCAAKIIHDDAPAAPVNTAISKDDIMMIATSCIGLYFIAAAMPTILRGLLYHTNFMLNRIGNPFAGGPSGLLTLLRELIVPAVQIAIGLCLFIGSSGLVKLWNKIRSQ